MKLTWDRKKCYTQKDAFMKLSKLNGDIENI